MSVPKTLKDIPFDSAGLCYQAHKDYVKKVREEAKKWKDFILHETCGEESTNVISAQTGWLIYFFNLEDEDK